MRLPLKKTCISVVPRPGGTPGLPKRFDDDSETESQESEAHPVKEKYRPEWMKSDEKVMSQLHKHFVFVWHSGDIHVNAK